MLRVKHIDLVCFKEMKNRPQLFPAVYVGKRYSIDEYFWQERCKFDNIPIHLNGELLEWYPKDLFITLDEWRNHQINSIID